MSYPIPGIDPDNINPELPEEPDEIMGAAQLADYLAHVARTDPAAFLGLKFKGV